MIRSALTLLLAPVSVPSTQKRSLTPSCESVEEAQTEEVARVEVEGDEFQVGELSRVLGSVCVW